ncbi:MAG: nitrate/sulfonate/bicarbonate ABC transporter ATP-binding protein [Acidimicrobiales bacterium]|jgi:NitT/TauT family transport system ATP-binding protein
MTTTSPTGPSAKGGTETILEVSGVSKDYSSADGTPVPVLDNISFVLREGEIVAMLGKSGAGKSTLLRCIAGLIAPSAGKITYRGAPVAGANPGVAMVFQTFALLPWLTVLQNVEVGLQARGKSAAECKEKALKNIDRIGLDGFESAYPRELSGGMQQRVGFARALAVEPDALLMDEPFSALDVLTAENLRTQLLSLWAEPDFPTKAMLIVTHNIEEAVILADRILILGTNPGRIRTELPCRLARPRDRRSEEAQALINEIYAIMTGGDEQAPSKAKSDTVATETSLDTTPLPLATVGGVAGLLEILAAHGGQGELPELAHRLNLDVQDLLPLVEAAQMLDLATVDGAHMELTNEGLSCVKGTIDNAKSIFARQARARAPLVRTICTSLEATDDGTLSEDFFLDLLSRAFTKENARQQLNVAVNWGRYGELYEFNARTRELKLERPTAAKPKTRRRRPPDPDRLRAKQ